MNNYKQAIKNAQQMILVNCNKTSLDELTDGQTSLIHLYTLRRLVDDFDCEELRDAFYHELTELEHLLDI